MYELKSPPEKIQALFFQALQPADKKLKPSDIQVTIKPMPEVIRQAVEDERVDAVVAGNAKSALEMGALSNIATVEIDFSKTSFAKHVGGMSHGLIDIGGYWSASDGKVLFRGSPNNFDNVKVKDIQRVLALSLSLPIYKDSMHLAVALGSAAMGRGRASA